MAVAFARMILALEKTDPRRALENAGLLAAWVVGALTTVTRQAAPGEPPAGSDPEGGDEPAHPQAIVAVLMCLMFIAARLKRRLLAELAGEHPLCNAERAYMIAPALSRPAWCLDSS